MLTDPDGEGPVLVGLCIAGTATDLYLTKKFVAELAEEEMKIQKQIHELESNLAPYPTEEDIKKLEQIRALQERGIQVARQKLRAHVVGYGLGVAVGIICAGAAAAAPTP